MPKLAWRTDADGFAFGNGWTFDATERNALSAAAQPLIAAAAGAVAPILIPINPLAFVALVAAANAELQMGPLPTYGMCGGMAYASADYWLAKMALPRGANAGDQPTRATPTGAALRDVIWHRLLDSLVPGGALQHTLEWSLILNQVPASIGPISLGGGEPGLLARTQQQWPIVKSTIDAGRACPIALVYTGRNVWDQHQILVYGYEDPGNGTGTMYVYDSNSPHQYGTTGHDKVTLDFRNPSGLVATSPSDHGNMLAGFFVTNYVPATPPPGLERSNGEFLTWTSSPRQFLATSGARMPIANAAELAALGGSPADVRSTGTSDPGTTTRPRDGALLRERSAAPVYLYAGGAPFWIPDPGWLARFGGWGAVRVVPDGTLAAFAGAPDDGTLLREWSAPKVYRIEGGKKRWVTSPLELGKWGGFPSVRLVPDGALNAIPDGPPLGAAPLAAHHVELVLVPDVGHAALKDAEDAMRAAGLVPHFTGPTDAEAYVVAELPHRGELVDAGSTVTLHLHAGPRG